jgi:hypothetical protein
LDPQGGVLGIIVKSHLCQARQGLAEVYKEVGIEYDFAPLMEVRKRICACKNEYARLHARNTPRPSLIPVFFSEERARQIGEHEQRTLPPLMEEYKELLAALPSV